ncbi:MAG TPA: transcriptional repressor LexA [Planctomycetota bacterium]|nr:transcriptional repressor LexA [Planctomycetota bacterium]
MTPRQLEALAFVEEFKGRHGVAPTLKELADHLRVSKPTALSLLRRLEKGRHIRRRAYGHRGIEVLTPVRKLPVVGRIAAGRPIEAIAQPDELDLFGVVRPGREYFVLQVRGDSMVGDHVQDGDYVICERRSTARDGETVVALLPDGQATLKRLCRDNGRIRLQPANPALEPLIVDDVAVQGVVVGLYRKV